MKSESSFQDEMKKLINGMSPEAQAVYARVVILEKSLIFMDRGKLPSQFAQVALEVTKESGGDS